MTSTNEHELSNLLEDQSSDEDDLAAIEQEFDINSDQAEDSDEPRVHKAPSGLAFSQYFEHHDGNLKEEHLDAIDERRQQTAAYLADETNYERLLEVEGGFSEIVRENAKREGTGYLKGQLHSIFTPERPTCIVTRQRPGAATSHLAFLVRIINLAAGGFFFLTSACGRKAFWTSFFPLIMPFFEAGGHGLIAIPAGELSVQALEEERSWQKVIEERTSGRLRFVFVTDYDLYQSWHIKEGLIVAPGGEMVDVGMSGNFNSRGVATEKATAPDSASAASKPGSAERMAVRRLHLEEAEGLLHVQDLGSYWFDLAQDNSLFYNVPSLLDFLAHRHAKDLKALRRSKRSRLIVQIVTEMDHEDLSDKHRQYQQCFTLARQYSSNVGAKQEQEADPLTAPIQLTNEGRKAVSSLVQEKKKHLSEFMSQFKQEWTDEEKVEIAAMNKEVINELIEYGGQEFRMALETVQAKKKALKSARATSIRPKPSKPPRKRSKKTRHSGISKVAEDVEAGAGNDADAENADNADNETASKRQRRAKPRKYKLANSHPVPAQHDLASFFDLADEDDSVNPTSNPSLSPAVLAKHSPSTSRCAISVPERDFDSPPEICSICQKDFDGSRTTTIAEHVHGCSGRQATDRFLKEVAEEYGELVCPLSGCESRKCQQITTYENYVSLAAHVTRHVNYHWKRAREEGSEGARCPLKGCEGDKSAYLTRLGYDSHLEEQHQIYIHENASTADFARLTDYSFWCEHCNQWVIGYAAWDSHLSSVIRGGLLDFILASDARFDVHKADQMPTRLGLCPFCVSSHDLERHTRFKFWPRQGALMLHVVDMHVAPLLEEIKAKEVHCPAPGCRKPFDGSVDGGAAYFSHLSETHGLDCVKGRNEWPGPQRTVKDLKGRKRADGSKDDSKTATAKISAKSTFFPSVSS
ncbi:uncharacterized protein JCM6883_004920 [Sporobolomyces salmoneus]|uniref:uncharacterized protein n=1 Tax=Sporobolomyces salmoneus TaxID=183962 RepID=UPI00317B8024